MIPNIVRLWVYTSPLPYIIFNSKKEGTNTFRVTHSLVLKVWRPPSFYEALGGGRNGVILEKSQYFNVKKKSFNTVKRGDLVTDLKDFSMWDP